MKTCPTCRAQFDDSMRFCLEDGTPLVAAEAVGPDDAETDTLILQAETNPKATEAVTEQWHGEPEKGTQEVEEAPRQKTQKTTAGARPTRPNEALPTETGIESEPRKSPGGGGMIFGGTLALGGLVLIGAIIGGIWWFANRTGGENISGANTNQTANLPVVDPVETANDGFSNIAEPGNETQPKNINAEDRPDPKTTPAQKPSPTPKPTPGTTPAPTATPPPPTPRPTRDAAPKRISGGVVNGRATSLPPPAYPAAARRAGASGQVNVAVLIDENGRVIKASAVSGHRLLRNSAVNAARRARFRPPQLNGQPVQMTGVIVYNFRP